MTDIKDKMAQIRAQRGATMPTPDDLISVAKLESIAKWSLVRGNYDAPKYVGTEYIKVNLGNAKAGRSVFAYRIGSRSWNVVYGNGIDSRSDNSEKYARPGFNVTQFAYGDGNVADVYRVMPCRGSETISQRALAYSPLEAKDSDSKDDVRIRQIRGVTLRCCQQLPEDATEFYLGGPLTDAQKRHVDCTYDTRLIFDRSNGVIENKSDSRNWYDGLFRFSNPARDWQSLGFVSDVFGYQKAVAAHFAHDPAAISSAMEMALKVLTLQQTITAMQVEFIWPGRVYTGSDWKIVSKAAVPSSHDQETPTLIKCHAMPTTGILRQLRTPGNAVGPCILLTLPCYHIRKAADVEIRNHMRSYDYGEKPSKLKQVLLYPCQSRPYPATLNPDLADINLVGVTNRCNFGGKNDYDFRGAVLPFQHAHEHRSAVAFCVNSPHDEALSAYWSTTDSKSCSRAGMKEEREYGWIADIDQIITRVGAMVAEHFFTSAS